MSGVGSMLAGLGGTKVAALLVVGGVVFGAVGGGVASSLSGGGSGGTSEGTLAVYACPESGEPLIMVQAGQQLLVTGRSDDSSWLRIHYPSPGRTEAWVPASPVTVQGALDSLPVATCAPEEAQATAPGGPEPSLTAIVNATASPPPSPSEEPPSATPAATPGVATITASAKTISYDTGGYCPTATTSVTLKTTVSAPAGATGVVLSWRKPGSSTFATTPMTLVSGTAVKGVWQAVLDTTANGLTSAGTLNYFATATDTAGATRRIPTTGLGAVTVAVCENVGPVITASSSSGKTLWEDPFGVSKCTTATNITATLTDTDGVTSALLFYKRPGDTTYASKAMNNRVVKGKWWANLDTLGDQISIVSAPNDVLSWYIKATDGKGVTSTSAKTSITVRRCDSEALGDLSAGYGTSCSQVIIYMMVQAGDRDAVPVDTLKVLFHWKVTDQNGKTVTGTAASSPYGKPGVWVGQTTVNLSGFNYLHTITVYVTTTDPYGGTSRINAAQSTVQNCG